MKSVKTIHAQHLSNLLFCILFFCGLLFCGVAAAQQQAGVELRIGSRVLEEGEVVDAQLVCTNTPDPATPRFSVPEGLDLRLTSSNPSRSAMTSIINGRRSDTTTFTFSMRLTGKKAGTYTLAPIEVAAGGATYATEAITIVVRKSNSTDQRDGDRLVFARLNVKSLSPNPLTLPSPPEGERGNGTGTTPLSLYVTQSFEATLTFAIRKFEADGRAVELGNLLQLVDGGGSDLSVFGTRFTSGEVTLNDSGGARHTYVVYRQTREIRAEQVGTMAVGPVFLKVNYPLSLRRSWFGGYEIADSRREIARADAINVEVKGPPSEGRPPDFTSVIGHYDLTAVAKPTRVEQGQPVTLTLVLKGEPLDGVAGPDLSRNPDLASRFDFTKDELTGEIEGQARVFRRAIFPRQLGEQTIPSIAWSYFDPQTERYLSLSTDPIPITVDPSTAHAASDEISDQPHGAPANSLTVLGGGISPNYIDAGRVLANQAFSMGPVTTAGTLAVPPALYLVMTLATRRRMRLRTDPLFARRHAAKRTARVRIGKALKVVGAAQQLDCLATAMTGYVSDRFGLPPGELTPGDVRALLRDRAASVADEVAGFLESCDAIRFAPGAKDGLSPADTAASVRRWIAEIEKFAP